MRPPTPDSSRRPHRYPRVIGAALSILCLVLPGFLTSPAAVAGSRSPYTITVAQTSGLTDGTSVPVEVTSSDPAKDPVGWVDIRICRPGVAYRSYAAVQARGHCGYSPGSSAYASVTGSATQDFAGERSGARSFPDRFIAGVGSASFAGTTLVCNATHPCDLVVSVFTSQTQFEDQSAQHIQAFTLTFLPFGKIDGCSGTAANALQTVSSDRLVEAYADWSRQACTSNGPSGTEAPTENTFLPEGGPFGAVASFANGNADLAYAAGGYDLSGFAEPHGRPYVAVPIALNAVVVAASGGQQRAAYSPKGSPAVTASAAFSHLELTAGQAASIFGGGYVSPAQTRAIDAANSELVKGAQLVPYTSPGGSAFVYPEAVAGVDATTLFASTYFKKLGHGAWNSGPHAAAGKPDDVHRGIFSSFAQPGASEPAFTSLGLYSQRTDLEKAALPYAGIGPLPLWVLSDRATASELGFTITSLGRGGKQPFIAPTKATMDAAVADMTTEPDGTLAPDIAKAAHDTNAYPLTFVEYVLAPTQPLVDASCTARTGSQQLMIKWLDFLTGAGQNGLAPGLEPLPPALRTQAAAAIAKVGTAAETGACAATATTTTTTTTPAATTTTTAISPPTTPPTTAPTTSTTSTTHPATQRRQSAVRRRHHRRATTTTVPTTPSTTAPPASGAQRLAAVEIPRFAGPAPRRWMLPSVALVALGLLLAGMALRTSGWSPAPLLATAGRRLRRLRPRRGRP
jgi:hypothetical protein